MNPIAIDRTEIRRSQPEEKPSQSPDTDTAPAAEGEASKVTARVPTARKKFGAAADAMTAALALLMAVGIWFSVDRHGLHASMKALRQDAAQMMSRVGAHHVKLAGAQSAGAREESSLAVESHASPAEPASPLIAKTHGAAPAKAKRAKGRTARRGSGQIDGPEEAAESPESLWQAVEKGSSTAEIKLADMYLQAKGVEKNCSQAEVLLTAAQHHNNALAVQRLADLAGYGCE